MPFSETCPRTQKLAAAQLGVGGSRRGQSSSSPGHPMLAEVEHNTPLTTGTNLPHSKGWLQQYLQKAEQPFAFLEL